MLIYNKTSQLFTEKLIHLSKDILEKEMSLSFKRSRVHYNGYSIPLSFCAFDHDKTLGFFDSNLYQIGVNINLFSKDEEILKNILRHELAHFYLQISCKESYQAHGKEFKALFSKFSWDHNFNKASIELNLEQIINNKIIKKIEKLLNLANSPNQYESELASKKAHHLLKKYNIENINNIEQDTYVVRTLEFKRRNPIVEGVYEVIKNYFVYPVINQGPTGGYLEIIGTRTNVIIAEYIASYLTHSINTIWNEQKDKHNLKGIVAKNSFIRSFFKELSHKLEKENKEMEVNDQVKSDHLCEKVQSDELILFEKNHQLQLAKRVQQVHPRLSRLRQSSKKNDSNASKLGKKKAQNFKIKSALESKAKSLGKFLTN